VGERDDFWDAGLAHASADLETERRQIPIRGLPQPTGCRPTTKFSPPPFGASSWQQAKKQTVFCYRPRRALLTLEAIKRFAATIHDVPESVRLNLALRDSSFDRYSGVVLAERRFDVSV